MGFDISQLRSRLILLNVCFFQLIYFVTDKIKTKTKTNGSVNVIPIGGSPSCTATVFISRTPEKEPLKFLCMHVTTQ